MEKVKWYLCSLAPKGPCSREVCTRLGSEHVSGAPLCSPHHFGVLAGNVQLEHITTFHTVNHPEGHLQRESRLRLRYTLAWKVMRQWEERSQHLLRVY